MFEAQMSNFEFLQEILIQINACFPRASEESNTPISILELFEYLNLSFTTLMKALVQLKSSMNSKSTIRAHGNARQKVAALDHPVVMNVQCLRAEATLAALLHLLKSLSGTEISIENNNSEEGVSVVLQMTRTLHEELAELATRHAVESSKQAVITKLADALEEFQYKLTPAMYALLQGCPIFIDYWPNTFGI